MHTIFSSFLMFLSLFGLGVVGGNPVVVPHSANQVLAAPAGSPHSSKPPRTISPPSPIPTLSVSPTPSASPSVSPTPGAAAEIATEAVCPGQSNTANTVGALTCLTQQARAYHHVGAISDQPALMAAAAAKAADMKSCGYGHEACGRAFDYEIHAKGYPGRCYGENIAYGQKSPHDVFVAWMNSPGHRANILNPDYRDLGVAETAGPNGPLWVMELGGC